MLTPKEADQSYRASYSEERNYDISYLTQYIDSALKRNKRDIYFSPNYSYIVDEVAQIYRENGWDVDIEKPKPPSRVHGLHFTVSESYWGAAT